MSVLFAVDSCDFGASIGYNALKHLFALLIVLVMCFLNVSLLSSVMPKYLTDLDNSIVFCSLRSIVVGFRLRLLVNGKMIA